MPLKFSLFNLEHSCCSDTTSEISNTDGKTMVKRKTKNSSKVKRQRDKFTKAVQFCHKTTKGRKTFGTCMKKKLKKKGGKK